MSANTVEPGTAPSGEPEGCGGLLARLLWMAGGTFGITATLLGITASGDEIGGRDVVLLALVIGMVTLVIWVGLEPSNGSRSRKAMADVPELFWAAKVASVTAMPASSPSPMRRTPEVWQAAPLLLTIRPFDQDAGVASW
mgnify:CR=1 FL=1